MTSEELIDYMASRADLPRYKVARAVTAMVQIIQYETAIGGTVKLPRLGLFRGRGVAAKRMKNVIAGRGLGPDGQVIRKELNTPGRRKLQFVPDESKKWLPTTPLQP